MQPGSTQPPLAASSGSWLFFFLFDIKPTSKIKIKLTADNPIFPIAGG
jgi:hypothetical protein